MSIKKSLAIALICFAVVPIIVISPVIAALSVGYVLNIKESYAKTLAHAGGAALRKLIASQEQDLAMMAARPLFAEDLSSQDLYLRPESIKTLFDWIDQVPHYANVWLADQSGRVVISYEADDLNLNISDLPIFQEIMDTGVIAADHTGVEASQRYKTQIIAAPVGGDNPIGVLVLFVSIDYLQSFVESISFGRTGSAFLTNASGTIMYHKDKSIIGKNVADELKSRIKIHKDGNWDGEMRTFIFDGDNGKVSMCEYDLAGLGWNLVIRQDYNELTEFTIPLILTAIVSLALWFAAALLYWRLFINKFTVNLSALKSVFLSGAAENKYLPSALAANNEIGELSASYNEMITRLDRSHTELETAYSRLAATEETLRADYAALHRREQDNAILAFRDSVTGMPNRAAFELRMERLFEAGATGGIVYVDMDNFRNINVLLGHGTGDSLLKRIGETLSETQVLDIDLCARSGSGHFLIIIRGYQREIEMYCRYLTERLEQPFAIGDTLVYITAGIGVVMFPKDGGTVEGLLKNAETAMRRSRELGKNNYYFFDDALRYKLHREAQVFSILQNSILQKEVFLVYQPEVSLDTNEILAVEALLRLKNKQLGFISPTEFIPIAEANGLMLQLGYWVLETACNFLKRLSDTTGYSGIICVNISAIQLIEREFAAKVSDILERTGVEPKRLQLEIREDAATGDFRLEAQKLNKLRKMGVSIALDDFGTAYSSLNHMAALPIDVVKIDHSFINDIFINDHTKIIIRTIIDTAHKLGLSVVAEGVEAYEQRVFLEDNFCDMMQGYVFSAPLEENAMLEILMNKNMP